MADRQQLPIRIRRAIFFRSNGRCEYGSCKTPAARLRDDDGIEALGNFSHILPVGALGPRWQFKQKFPEIDLDSKANVILLCADHHRLVDREQVAEHPPALLFEMVKRKSEIVQTAFEVAFASSPERLGRDELLDDIRVGRVLELLHEARSLGPKNGRTSLARAATLLQDIVENPFLAVPEDYLNLLSLHLIVVECANRYNAEQWRGAEKRAVQILGRIRSPKELASAILLASTFVRDEYRVLESARKLTLIKSLLDHLNVATLPEEKTGPRFANLLALRAGLLRWRGRLLRSELRDKSFEEAVRCATLSLSRHPTPTGTMQLVLIEFTRLYELPLSKARDYTRQIEGITAQLLGKELDDLPAAIKYRPHYLRDIYEFRSGIDYFWRAVDAGYGADMRRIAYVLGECAAAIYWYVATEPATLQQALDFLQEAITDGFAHNRNFIAWITCRALCDPSWFREQVLDRFDVDHDVLDYLKVIRQDSARYFGSGTFSHDLLFGIDEADYWNMLGTLSRTAVDEPDLALAFYQRAERHGSMAGGTFTTRTGRTRACIRKGDPAGARRHLLHARGIAKAYQARVIRDLEAEIAVLDQQGEPLPQSAPSRG